jgi:hypothetical protein
MAAFSLVLWNWNVFALPHRAERALMSFGVVEKHPFFRWAQIERRIVNGRIVDWVIHVPILPAEVGERMSTNVTRLLVRLGQRASSQLQRGCRSEPGERLVDQRPCFIAVSVDPVAIFLCRCEVFVA